MIFLTIISSPARKTVTDRYQSDLGYPQKKSFILQVINNRARLGSNIWRVSNGFDSWLTIGAISCQWRLISRRIYCVFSVNKGPLRPTRNPSRRWDFQLLHFVKRATSSTPFGNVRKHTKINTSGSVNWIRELFKLTG